MKAKVLGMVALLGSMTTYAKTTVEDLKLDCQYEYKILESQNYHIDNYGTRAPDFNGVAEVIEVLSIQGPDCQKIEDHYGVKVSPGAVIDLGPKGRPIGKLKYLGINHDEIGKVKHATPSQYFSFKLSNGELPWFPHFHAETVQIFHMVGTADVEALYGTKKIKDLEDKFLLKTSEKIMSSLSWGKDLQDNYIGADNSVKLKLLHLLTPKSKSAKEDFLQDLILLFSNGTKYDSSFTSGHHNIEIGKKVNALLNEFGQTKFGTPKLKVFQKNPALFADQLVSWIYFTPEKAPMLTEVELEEFLDFALEKVKVYDQVPELYEARVLQNQYVNAAKTIKKFSTYNHPTYKRPHYELSTLSEQLITEILKF
jgi:hypothetical protein